MQTWTVKKLLDWSINYFKEKSVSQARLSSELLLGSALGFSRMQLYLNYNYAPTQKELDKFKKYILKRLQGVPIQYILKEAHFRKIKLYVDENVLIPRPETELVVEKAVEAIGRLAKNRDKVEILEVGVGSGAISLSILFELKGLNYNILATDNSEQAIRVAQKNADNILGKEELERIKFSLCDILPEESG
ncbi:MAG: HemK/PrmC family methyltransferase, partial [Candidatus Humimicrobiaceae bacterium]